MRSSTFALALALMSCIPFASARSGEATAQTTVATRAFAMLPAASLKTALDRGQAVSVYDANSRETYENSHVPGATWIEFDSLTAASLPAEKDARLVFYCANEMCTASHWAAKQALALGYTDVNVMPEGIQGWEKAGYPVARGAAQ